jgi:hypothetical protein
LYAELYKYNGTTFTLISTSSNEILYDGVNLNLYTFAMAVPATTLAITDRLAVKLYATNSGGKTTTVHTQDSHLCQIITTFSTGITALNGLTAQVQYFATGTSGSDFNISSSTATHTFNIPDASASARGLITTSSQVLSGIKTFSNGLILQYNYFPTPSTGDIGLGSNASGITITTKPSTTVYNNTLQFASASNTFTFPNASGTIALLESTQTFSGVNTFTSLNMFDASINYKTGGSIVNTSGYIAQGYAKSGTGAGSTLSLKIADGNSVKAINLDFVGSPATYTYTFPATSGTVALTSNLSGYIPYTGATASVNLGVYSIGATTGAFNNITSNNDNLGDIGSASYKFRNIYATGLSLYKTSGITTINFPITGSQNDAAFIQHEESTVDTGIMRFSVSDNDLTNDYFVFGNTQTGTFLERFKITATGVVTLGTWQGTAITDSYISSASTWNNKLNLSGGTLTGPLNGTSATFSSTLRVNGGTTTIYDNTTATLNLNTNPDGEQTTGWLQSGGFYTILGSTGAVYLKALSTTILSVLDYNSFPSGTANGTSGNVLIATSVAQGVDKGGVLSLGGWTTSTGSTTVFGRVAGRKENSTSGNQAGYLAFETASASPNQSFERMRIRSSGVVSIGLTAGTSGLLDIKPGAATSDGVTLSATYSGAGSYGPFIFQTSDTNRMTITSTGKIQAINSLADVALDIRNTNSAGYGAAIQGGNGSSNYSLKVVNYNDSATYLYVRGDGLIFAKGIYDNPSSGGTQVNVGSDGNLIRFTSSIKYKKDIVAYDKGLDYVNKIKPVYYKSKNENTKDRLFVGLIAEDIHDLGLTEFVEYNDEGEPDSLHYQNMIALLTKAIQELSAQVNELKNK